MSVTWARPDYQASLPDWERVDDIVFGRNLRAYIPVINKTDTSPENQARNEQYFERAVFYGFSGHTFKGMVGAAYKKDPKLELPPQLEYLAKDADGAGVSVYQQSQSILGDVIRIGRAGLFVSFPQVEGASREDMANGRARATLHHIPAEAIINWRYQQDGARQRLSLVVFSFTDDVIGDDGFSVETVTKYRHIALEDGVYVDRTWAQNGSQWEVESEFQPLDGSGQPWREIPFSFVGSENNDASIDPIPLQDLVRVNIGHYRNSADYEDSVFYAGQPQPWASGIDQAWSDMAQQAGFYIGSRALMPVPTGEKFGFASADPNPLAGEAMREKVAQMIALGARLVQPGSAPKTATQAASESEVQHSILSLAVANVTEAYQIALGWAAQYMNVDGGEIEFEINREFGIGDFDPQAFTSLLQGVKDGVVTVVDVWAWLRQYIPSMADKTDDELQDDLDSQDFLPNPAPVAQQQEAVPNV